MTESKGISLKFILINFLFTSAFILFMPIIEIIVILLLNPSWNRPSEFNYLSKPLLFSIPLFYLILSLLYLICKNKLKSILFFLIFIYVSLGFFMWNHDKKTFDDFKILFHLKVIDKK